MLYTGSRMGHAFNGSSYAAVCCLCHCPKQKTTAESDCVYASVTLGSFLKPPVTLSCSKMPNRNWSMESVNTDCFLQSAC